MRVPAVTLLSLAAWAAPVNSHAREAELAEGPSGAIELEVRPDPFARFDHTRWRVDSQIGLPYPAVMYAFYNDEVQFVAADVRMVVACDLDGQPGRTRAEVSCVIEDAAVSLTPWLKHLPERSQRVLDDADGALTGLQVQLQVGADGRVLDVGLVGEPQTNRRINRQYENLRQLVLRSMLGFHMRTPSRFDVGQEWTERDSRLFSLPVFRYSGTASAGAGLSLDVPGATTVTTDPSAGRTSGVSEGYRPQLGTFSGGASGSDEVFGGGPAQFGVHPMEILMAPVGYGRSAVVNRMDMYKGQYLVQSTGEGVVDMGADLPMVFQGDLSSVSVYDPALGYLTERRWNISLAPTASSPLANGVAGWPYWQVGSLTLLGDDEVSDVGPSQIVSRMDQAGRGQLVP